MPAQSIRSARPFQLRLEQVETLLQESLPRHLRQVVTKVWPEQTAAMTDDALMERLEAGIERARGHGIEDRDNITRFVHLSFLLGREDFDTAPETSWAGIILGWNMGGTKKLDKLEARAELEQERAMMPALESAASPPVDEPDARQAMPQGESPEKES